MADAKPMQGDVVGWIRFPEGNAHLRRFIAPGDIRGLLLKTRDDVSGRKVLDIATAFGFSPLRSGAARMVFPEGRTPFSARALAETLGGEVFAMSRDELLSDKWTVNLSSRAPAMPAPRGAPVRVLPDPDTIRPIGLNAQGEDVVRDATGRFFRRAGGDFIHEGDEDRHTRFLRAARVDDLGAIASGLVVMAGRGTLHSADFDRVLGAALEEGPHGRLDMDPGAARDVVRRHMMREIASVALEDDASRDRFVRSLRLASNTSYVLSVPGENGMLSPSPALAAFLRRHVRDQSAVDYRGAEDMKEAVPRVFRQGADLQVHDFGGISADGAGAYAANVLARRPADGRSVFRLPFAATEAVVERMRSEVGRGYALEAVCEAQSAVADGIPGGTPSTIFFVGERRPEMIDALPQAALRTFRAVAVDDLISLEREIGRSRNRIRDFHGGVEAEIEAATDEREENVRQRPYQSLSRSSEPFSMIPVALEGATAKALERVRRDMEDRGGPDAVVAGLFGMGLDDLSETFTAEQVDAIAMRIANAERGRGFLLADATGVGKGRSLAAIAHAHLRTGPYARVVYFTESGTINIPDVCRDLRDVGAWDKISPLFLSIGSQVRDDLVDPVTGETVVNWLKSPPAAVRKAIYESGRFPDGVNIVITTYGQFRSKEGEPSSQWLRTALDENTLLILDEAQNATNEHSAQGANLRAAIAAVVRPENVVFGTATPGKKPKDMTLYRSLLPQEGVQDIGALMVGVAAGGEIAQEAFATMLAEDGVMLRRDKDLSNTEFRIALPDDATILRYQDVMDRISPVVEMMIECNGQIGEHVGRLQARQYRENMRAGMDPAAARAAGNEMNQYSISLGSPLSNLARIAMNAVKVDQTVDAALAEIQEGRKPLITFHSTNAGLLDELSRGEDGRRSLEAMEAAMDLTLRDQVNRIHESMYRLRRNGEVQDARDIYPDVRQSYEIIRDRIGEIPAELPVSPVDALIGKLEDNGVTVGEISGRVLCYRDGHIQHRQNRSRRDTVDGFNDGRYDVVIFNSAGATGGSLHASSTFSDQRPRTTIEHESPTDVIKSVQGYGRGDRYGQVAKPRVVSVSTGLVPEMRILQQRNRKLRALGASVDGNRSHPMLLDDVPDLLNKVGDEATSNVLRAMPALARRLGFPEYAVHAAMSLADNGDTGSGADMDVKASLSNQVLTRSIMLSAVDQTDLVARIRMDFDSLIEELDSRNANPLRPKELEGRIEIRATTLFSGAERDADDLDESAFSSPLYMSTAIHHWNDTAWSSDRLVTEIEATRRLYGSDGFVPMAERIRQNMPHLLRPFLVEGVEIDDAMATPCLGGARFDSRHKNLTEFAALLENIRPGVALAYPHWDDEGAPQNRTVIGLRPPTAISHYDVPSAYSIRTIMPGEAKPEIISLSRLMMMDPETITFRPGVSDAFEENYLAAFDRDLHLERRRPVQVLTGNVLQAIAQAKSHNLGSVSLYRDMDGAVHRGVVVPKSKVDMDYLPVPVSSGSVAAEVAHRLLEDPVRLDRAGAFRIWGGIEEGGSPGERENADITMFLTPRSLSADVVRLRKSTYDFYRKRPGLHEALRGEPLPPEADVPKHARRFSGTREKLNYEKIPLDTEEGRERAMNVLRLLGSVPLMTDGRFRDLVNGASVDIERITREARRTGALENVGADVADAPGNDLGTDFDAEEVMEP